MCSVPTSDATFSSAADIFFSRSFLSHSGVIFRPCSPVSRLSASSLSVRSFPPARTFQGARAMPSTGMRINVWTRRMWMLALHTFRQSHRNDIALEVAVHDVPSALVDNEWCQSMVSGVLICFRNDPRRGIRYALKGNISGSWACGCKERIDIQDIGPSRKARGHGGSASPLRC